MKARRIRRHRIVKSPSGDQRAGGERRTGGKSDGAVVLTVTVTVAASVPSSVIGLGGKGT
jgi:hypothetical protein